MILFGNVQLSALCSGVKVAWKVYSCLSFVISGEYMKHSNEFKWTLFCCLANPKL